MFYFKSLLGLFRNENIHAKRALKISYNLKYKRQIQVNVNQMMWLLNYLLVMHHNVTFLIDQV